MDKARSAMVCSIGVKATNQAVGAAFMPLGAGIDVNICSACGGPMKTARPGSLPVLRIRL